MFYGKNITITGEPINVQMSFSPLVYSDTFIEITAEEYSAFIEEMTQKHLAHKKAINNRYGEEIVEEEQEIQISELERAIRKRLKEEEEKNSEE